MSITELQTLIINGLTMGAFVGFIVAVLLSIFGRRE